MNNMDTITKIADHAAGQSDRWMFVVILAVFLIFLGVIWRWMVADREKVAKRLTEITDRHIEQSSKLSEVVANNTHALREVSSVVLLCRSKINKQE